jgi:hypothetical protein
VALRPRLSPGVPLSRCGRYGRAVYRRCQASSVRLESTSTSRPMALQTRPSQPAQRLGSGLVAGAMYRSGLRTATVLSFPARRLILGRRAFG